MLKVSHLHAGYSQLTVLKGLTFEVRKGQVVALLGSNGAGKTTTLHALMGLIRPQRGTVVFDDRHIEFEPSHRIFKRGLSLVPQWRELFAEMSVMENLELGVLQRRRKGDIGFRVKKILEFFPGLHPHLARRAGTLSGGQQQMLATARALMSEPMLLMLDEPSMGLAPLVVAELRRTIEKLNRQGTTILLVEQNIHLALSLADYVYVIRNGTVVAEGDKAKFRDEQELFRSYIG